MSASHGAAPGRCTTSCNRLGSRRWQHLQRGAAAFAPLDERQPWGGAGALHHQLQPLGLEAVGAHLCQHIYQLGRALTDAQPPAVAQQPGGDAADIGRGAQQLVAGDAAGAAGGHRAAAGGEVGRVTGDEIELLGSKERIGPADITLYRPHVLETGAPDGVVKLGHCRGLDIEPGNSGGGDLPLQHEGDDAAAGAQVEHPVGLFGGGKTGQQKGVTAKAVLGSNGQLQATAQIFVLVVHVVSLPSLYRTGAEQLSGPCWAGVGRASGRYWAGESGTKTDSGHCYVSAISDKTLCLGLYGSTYRAGTGAGAAVDAGICVDHVFVVTSGDSAYGAIGLARTTADALVSDFISHW